MRNNRNMRRENRLLADIVEANGGVVTNKDNRCKLLQDWLDSILYKDALLINGDILLMNGSTVVNSLG